MSMANDVPLRPGHISGIYRIWLIDDPKTRSYIGSTEDMQERWNHHRKDLRNGRHHCQHLQRTWDKYGASQFNVEIIELCDVDDLVSREQFWLDANVGNLFNGSPTAGRTLGFKHSEETRRKMSISRMGNPSNTGRKLTEEHKAHISASSPLKTRTHCTRGHLYDEENTYITRDGARSCRQCNKEDLRAYRATPEGRAATRLAARKYEAKKRALRGTV